MEIGFLTEVTVTDVIWNTSINILQAFEESKWLDFILLKWAFLFQVNNYNFIKAIPHQYF